MAHMLPMSASQVGNPVAVLIQMKPDDRLIHGRTPGRNTSTGDSLFAGN